MKLKMKTLTALAFIAPALLCNLPASAETCPTSQEIQVTSVKPQLITEELLKKVIREAVLNSNTENKGFILANLDRFKLKKLASSLNEIKDLKGFYQNEGKAYDIEDSLQRIIGRDFNLVDTIITNCLKILQGNTTYISDKFNLKDEIDYYNATPPTFYRARFVPNQVNKPEQGGIITGCEYGCGKFGMLLESEKNKSSPILGEGFIAHATIEHPQNWHKASYEVEGKSVYLCDSSNVEDCSFEVNK